MKNIVLQNGVNMPVIGFGTWKAPKDEITCEAVKTAIECGYRHIDAAAIYGNEKFVGKGIKESNVKREELFVTSKLWNSVRGYEETINAFNKSLEDLGIEYLDLYLIHWPVPKDFRENYIEKNLESWRAFEDLYKAGKVRAIGVSNFKEHHLDELMEKCEIMPMVNQIEFHPSHTQDSIREYCEKHNIVVQGYSPLANGKVFECKEIAEIAEKNGVGVAQLCVKYALSHNVVPLVKSVTRERILENLKLDFELSSEDIKKIDEITTCEGMGADSDNINF